MSAARRFEYLRGRWPGADIPQGEPEWLLYEVDRLADAVLRSVEIFPDGNVTRNSIELEQRNGDVCPSLMDDSLDQAFKDAPLEQIAGEEFETFWMKGVDTPFWFPR